MHDSELEGTRDPHLAVHGSFSCMVRIHGAAAVEHAVVVVVVVCHSSKPGEEDCPTKKITHAENSRRA